MFIFHSRCISGDHLRLDGTTVNDSHAEVVARRGLVRFLQRQLDLFHSRSGDAKCIFSQSQPGKVQLRRGVHFHLYISTAPCGDAAIFVNEQLGEYVEDFCSLTFSFFLLVCLSVRLCLFVHFLSVCLSVCLFLCLLFALRKG